MLTPPKTKLPKGQEYPGQIPPSQVKRHNFLNDNVLKKLPAVCPPAKPHTPTPHERRIPSTPKTTRHPLAQQWRDAKKSLPCPIAMGKGSGEGALPTNIKLLPAPIQPLLLSAGAAYDACQLIALAPKGYPVVLFLKEFGAALMSDLLNAGKVTVKKDHLFMVEPQPAPDMVAMVAQVEAADDASRQTAAEHAADREQFTQLLTLDTPAATPAPVEPPKRVSSIAPLFKKLPSNQNLNPLGNAVVDRQMKLNTTTAFSLAGQIHDDANAAHKWLRALFGITPGSLITSDKLAEVQKAVTQEQLKFVNKQTLAAINAWGMEIYGVDKWHIQYPLDTLHYSARRTKYMRFLHQTEGDLWLRDLRLKATPEQTIAAGRRLDVIVKGALTFGSRKVQ